MSGILFEMLQQRKVFKRRYKILAKEVERLKDTDDKKQYHIRYGQMIELELMYGNIFGTDGDQIWKED